jgi:hypothetical protein
MARGIKENWKQPLGYVLVNIIDELTQEVGLKIETFISDLG